MACPACGCKVAYQFDGGNDECGLADDEDMERCAACGHVFHISEHTEEDEWEDAQS